MPEALSKCPVCDKMVYIHESHVTFMWRTWHFAHYLEFVQNKTLDEIRDANQQMERGNHDETT